MKNEEKTYDLFKFEDGDFSLDVMVSFTENTVWLSAQEIAYLFERNYKTIQKHINNIFFENELEKASNSQKMRLTGNAKPTQFYNLNVIIAVGYRVNSKRGTLLKIWADSILNNNTTIDDYNIRNMPIIGEKYQLVKFVDGGFSLDVKVSPEENTVWLTQKEMSLLFNVSVDSISLHIKNILKDEELDESVFEESSITASDGKKYKTYFYNLDMIISVGYRVKSKRGVLFRRWATSILKQYLLNGYSINKDRIIAYQSNILQLEANVMNIEKRLKNIEETVYSNNSQIIFEGEILKPYSFIVKLFYLANKEIIIIDQYADKLLLDMLDNIEVPISIYTSTSSYLNKIKDTINNNITIIYTDVFHDRYIIVDDNVYNLGTSINSIGKKRFVISKLDDINIEILLSKINIDK